MPTSTTSRSRPSGRYEGKLEDVSDIIEPMRAKFEPQALSTTFLYNDKAKKRAYYAFPIKQQTMHIQYWKDMLAEAGFKESDIPKDWKGYWSFWCDKVQPAYRQKTGHAQLRHRPPDGRGFERLVLLVPDLHGRLQRQAGQRLDGKLLVDDPDVRAGPDQGA